MPELPEVQALVTDLGGRLTGRTVDRLDLLSFAVLKTFDPPVTALNSQVIGPIARHGKYLDIAVGDLHVLIHLALMGWIKWRDDAPALTKGLGKGPLAARLVLDDGSGLDFVEYGTKKGMAIHVVRDPMDVERVATLGPDPLTMGLEQFAAILAGQGRAQIKGVLRSQSVIAGIGNAYSDEILHLAKMSPFKPATMGEADVERLYEAMQVTLREAIARSDGLAASELKKEKKSNLQVHGRNGLPCPVCGDIVRQVIFADSTFQYCPTCQTGGKPLADRVLSRLLK
jgi:formamidopyrimidine-DNA glycosylase